MLKRFVVSSLIIFSLTIFGCASTLKTQNWVTEKHIEEAISYIETWYSGRMYLNVPGSGRINMFDIIDDLINNYIYEIDSIEPYHSSEESYITINFKNIRNESTLSHVLKFSFTRIPNSSTVYPIDYNYYFPALESNVSNIYKNRFYNWSWFWKIRETIAEKEAILSQYRQNGLYPSL